MIYRLEQLKNALLPRITKEDLEWVRSMLPEQGYKLFLTQSAVEQRHALDVAHSLMKYADQLNRTDFTTLIQASLLHDCGKSMVKITLWHRVIIVLTHKIPSPLSQIMQKYSIFALSIKISDQHPLWGKDLAQKAGLTKEICEMIEHHHTTPLNPLDRLLYSADNEN